MPNNGFMHGIGIICRKSGALVILRAKNEIPKQKRVYDIKKWFFTKITMNGVFRRALYSFTLEQNVQYLYSMLG